jgi:AraC-like DNA-binding protein
MPAQDASASVRFSTAALPAAARAKAVRELYERAIPPDRPEPFEPLPDFLVSADITKWMLPGLSVISGTLGGLRQAVRSSNSVLSSEDDLLVAINLKGRSTAQQRDQELVLRDGDAVLVTRASSTVNLTHPTLVRFMGFRVPRDAIAPLVSRLGEGLVQVVPHDTKALNLLITYASAIAGELRSYTPELQRLVGTHIQDLIAATVGATRDGQEIAEGRGIRAARLRAIMADIIANIGDCDLTVGAVAQRQRVTPRYVHKLFEGEGLTFSTFVLGRRLARAHRMFSDQRLGDRTISSVAFDVGFGDLSYFNRAFRRRYDATPSEIRHSAENDARRH